ncbi:unnamed protein product [Anisakis simplex]|uniref:Transmembrane protein 144 (inferred by orthology to a human protein) n=1 Tax=Anisakis simplex TaxID=6269 RepID=A0A0M3J0R0_ANISI|nr:unnamed protein product [Anisakis simplex]
MGLAVFMGVLHGLMMTPVVYIMDTDPHASKNVLDFMFAHFSTIFAFSTLYFILYSIYKRNRPYAAPELVLPSVAYGILWSIGMVLFFVSNDKLSQVVSFPITTRLPSTIGILADVFLFRSIKGRRNLALMSAGVVVALTGVVLIAISNQDL